MIRIYEVFPNKLEAAAFVDRMLALYPPEGYETRLLVRYSKQLEGYTVEGCRAKSCD